ncbi:dienelactone hydrolase [Metschnikowia bicuspidata var. bicuspidata NRRL YB-4993]|uniref:Dienelactone hydrolase n=1 Tax=Metschnikowia bicuspidata var. bicuspidata NRRL YB-4993 TaxID=869754 RepID=A0A1A0HDS9_9ASCO|nr:dienelactone hydrolase [Metschnikowia bicuspidata var. bicuspidata NRRL YB-4993]OBA22244.1 dienelactone hydrolase [Metschnikowia bicuspidata var. bicuspidata NRRL YB-4993]
MASNPPGKCCAVASFHEGTPSGNHETIYGLDTYVSGSEHSDSRVIVILTDVYGHKLNNTLLVADQFAKAGYKVYIPDILKGDPISDSSVDFPSWLLKHTNEITRPIVDEFLKALRKDVGISSFIGVVGYCFGAKFTVQHLAEEGLATAGAIAHPSFVTIDEVAAIKKPLVISAAEIDPIFTTELRQQTEAKLAEIKARYQLTLFSGVSHGFSIKGDIEDPVVKYAKEKTLADQLQWFSMF